jgi:hypothetical protein
MKEIKHTILYCVCEIFCDSILLRFRFRYGKKNDSYSSGSATLNRSRRSRKSKKISVSTDKYTDALNRVLCHLNIHHHQAVAGSLEGEVAECLTTNLYFQTFLTDKAPELKTGIAIGYQFVTKTKQISCSGAMGKCLAIMG